MQPGPQTHGTGMLAHVFTRVKRISLHRVHLLRGTRLGCHLGWHRRQGENLWFLSNTCRIDGNALGMA